MDPRVRATLVQLMRSQAYRELAAARLFGTGLGTCPDIPSLKFMVWHIKEEVDHYAAVARMYESFTGEDVTPWVHERLESSPIPGVETWFELAMAQFLYDRGGFWQLQEYEDCCFEPYREVVRKIIEEERGHQDKGEQIAVALCCSGEYGGVKQEVFARWLRQGLLSFGRPGTEGAAFAIEAGIKKRDPSEVIQDFLDDIKPAVRRAGLYIPPLPELGIEAPASIDIGV